MWDEATGVATRRGAVGRKMWPLLGRRGIEAARNRDEEKQSGEKRRERRRRTTMKRKMRQGVETQVGVRRPRGETGPGCPTQGTWSRCSWS
jgi:hypothetical protein